jgi:hypothetical protein
MKQSYEWKEEDIISLVENKIEESINLDYKECRSLDSTDGKKNEISKDVSAFANAAGGTIVYGVKEEGHVPAAIDNGFNPREISKEWLEQVIDSKIQPKIEGVIINPVELTTINPGHFIYVVFIPQALSKAPHQASDKRYYKRYNFKSSPMDDYEIRDLFARQSIPDLFLEFYLSKDIYLNHQLAHKEDRKTIEINNNSSQEIELFINIGNKSNQPAEYSTVEIIFPSDIDVTNTSSFKSRKSISYLPENIQYLPQSIENTILSCNLTIPNHMPIFRGYNYTLTEKPIKFKINKGKNISVAWNIHCPKCERKIGFLEFCATENKLILIEKTLEHFLQPLIEKNNSQE